MSKDLLTEPDEGRTEGGYLIAADTGGTFTDLTVFNTRTGELRFSKTLTTYDRLVRGVLSGLEDTQTALEQVELFKHGTTHVINAFIERKGARTALITTRGFRDVLEIARGNRPETFNLHYRRQDCLIPRRFRYEVDERLSGQGEVITPLDEASVTALIPVLRENGIEAVAISLLNSYANPVHEERIAALLSRLMPELYVTTGTGLSREWMEFERTSTAAANAFVGVRMSSYVNGFLAELEERKFGGKFYVTSSNGGVIASDDAVAMPIALVESGPVGGCIGATVYAQALDLPRTIAFDMGGTTAKCVLIEEGAFDVLNTYWVGGYESGFPIRTSVVDIVEVGAGGGSVAWIDVNGRMRVGPHSAGSDPGPVAFGRGGQQPTVTDANVVLGRIGTNSFMDGRLPLDVGAAAASLTEKLADPLGYVGEAGLDKVAQGILDMANVTMAGAIKEISIKRGRDVRSYTLFAFGGGGPLVATELARDLGITDVVIPPHPGTFSSLGMLMTTARRDATRTFLQRLSAEAVAASEAAFVAMEAEVKAMMSAEFDVSRISYVREADMKYSGQAHSIRITLSSELSLPEIRRMFETKYQERYGTLNADVPIEFVAVRSSGIVPTKTPSLKEISGTPPLRGGEVAPHSRRQVYFGRAGQRLDAPVYRRADLPVGCRLTGPAIIEEFTSTAVIGAGDVLTVGELGELRITCNVTQGRKGE